MTRRLVALAVLGLLPLTLSACVFEVREITPSTDGPSVDAPAAADVPEPVPSAGTPAALPPLDVALDPSGRPYDVSLQDGFTVRTDLVGRLRLEGRPLVAGPGEGVLRSSGDEAVTVPLPRLDHVEVYVVAAGPGPGDGSVAGVVLRAPGGVVSAWSPFEPAYGTDGGMGAVWVEDATGDYGDPRVDAVADDALDQLIAGASWVLTDADGDGDDDTFLFGNGWGDGSSPCPAVPTAPVRSWRSPCGTGGSRGVSPWRTAPRRLRCPRPRTRSPRAWPPAAPRCWTAPARAERPGEVSAYFTGLARHVQ